MITSIVEFSAYFSICLYINKHDKLVQNLISKTSFQKRKRENAINFTGHFIHFLMEIALILLSWKFDHFWIWDLEIFGFGTISVVTLMFSSPLRKELIDTVHSFRNLFPGWQLRYQMKKELSIFSKPNQKSVSTTIPTIVIEEDSDSGPKIFNKGRRGSTLSMASTKTVVLDMPIKFSKISKEEPNHEPLHDKYKTNNFLLPSGKFNGRRPLSNMGERKSKVSKRGENLMPLNVSSEVERKTVALLHHPNKKSSMPDVDC